MSFILRFLSSPTICLAFLVTIYLLTTIESARSETTFTNAQKNQIKEMIGEYLNENPELLMDAIRGIREHNEKAQESKTRSAINSFKDHLRRDTNFPTIGKKNASVLIVEFFDYRCGYCKRVLTDIEALLSDDSDIYFVFAEYPIIGEDSLILSKVAVAIWLKWPEHYIKFHSLLMETRGSINLDNALAIASKLNINITTLQNVMLSNEVDQVIKRNYDIAKSLNINGTPAFLIGDKIIPGAIDYFTMQSLVQEARGQ